MNNLDSNGIAFSFLYVKQLMDIGANIPMKEGFPLYKIVPGFHACADNTPKTLAPTPVRTQHCYDKTVNAATVRFCVFNETNTWREQPGNVRVVSVQGTIENVGDIDVCGLEVGVEGFEKALSSWPAWFPKQTEYSPLSPGNVISFGANIPTPTGKPNLWMNSFDSCASKMAAWNARKLRGNN
jgi:hypothetical protein